MNPNPITVLCPTCLAGPGKPCKSVVSWFRGINHGHGSVIQTFHNARRAKASGLKIVRQDDDSKNS